MNVTQQVRMALQHEDLAPGDRMVCPACDGGSSFEESLSIWEAGGEVGGTLMATCHRNRCSLGTIRLRPKGDTHMDEPLGGMVRYGTRKDDRAAELITDFRDLEQVTFHASMASALCRYYPAIIDMSEGQVRRMFTRYVKRLGDRLYMPIYHYSEYMARPKAAVMCAVPAGFDMRAYGIVLRALPDAPAETKAYTMFTQSGHDGGGRTGLAWYIGLTAPRYTSSQAESTIAVFEDQLSAMIFSLVTGGPAVALLGTNINLNRLEEMSSVFMDQGLTRDKHNIVLLLDADATSEALSAVSRFGGLYNLRAHRLVTDVKNMQYSDVVTLARSLGCYD